jgi:SAM-dependent methyltransferase
MDARELRYEDESFDGIFSSGSIEHFGTIEEIRRSAEEMFRVLRPGGVLSLSTEFRLEGPPPGLPGIVMFDAEQLDEYLVGGLDWTPVSAFDAAVSEATLASVVPLSEAAADVAARRPEWTRYPHIVFRDGGLLFTSVHLGLRKNARQHV